MINLIKSDTDTGHFIANIKGPLHVKGFYFTVEGVNDVTGISPHDIGRVYLLGRGGVPLVPVDFDMLQAYNNVNGGNPTVLNPLAVGAMKFDCYIPRNYKDDNIELIEPDDNMLFRIDFGPNVAAHIASDWVVKLYADIDRGITKYQLTMSQQELSLGGAGTFSEIFSHENIVQAYISDIVADCITLAASPIDHLTVKLGDRSAASEIEDLIGCTNLKSQLEVNTQLIALMAACEGDLTSRLEDVLSLNLNVGGACTPQILLTGAQFNPDKSIITDTDAGQRLIQKIDYKEQTGRTRTAGVLKRIVTQQVEGLD